MNALHGIHLGDSHFVEGVRFEECVRIHQWIVDYVRRERPSFVLHGGDMFHRGSTPLERLAAADFWRQILEVCPAVEVEGNHDRKFDIRLLAQLRGFHPLHIIEDARIVEPVPGFKVAGMAWPKRLSTLDEDGSKETIRALLRGFASERPDVLLGHFMTDGAKTGAGQPLIGGALGVSLADLALAGARMVCMSHIHAPQGWAFDGVPMLYAGSPFRTDFGEHEAKSIVHMHFEPGQAPTFERIETPARGMILFEADFDPAYPMSMLVAPSTKHCPAPIGAFRGSDVRLVYRFPNEYRKAAQAAAEQLRAEWVAAGAASVKLDDEPIVTTRSRAPEVAAATTLEDKLKAYWVAKDNVPEPPRAERLLHCARALQVTP